MPRRVHAGKDISKDAEKYYNFSGHSNPLSSLLAIPRYIRHGSRYPCSSTAFAVVVGIAAVMIMLLMMILMMITMISVHSDTFMCGIADLSNLAPFLSLSGVQLMTFVFVVVVS